MIFDIHPYCSAFVADFIEKGIWEGYSWTEIFHKLGFSSYKFYNYNKHQLSDEEFLIFVLRYSS